MLKGPFAWFLTSSLLVVVAASAEPPKTVPAPTTVQAQNPGAAASPRRDPKGVKGISPLMEALKKGDNALIARDFEGAVAAYRDAITAAPQNAQGHYRMGEAQLAKGDLHEAEEAFAQGLRFVAAADAGLKAKLQFLLADLRERQKAYDDATVKWTDYESFTTGEKAAQGFPATATERKKVLETWKRVSADSAAVKQRIDKRLKEADESVRKSSQ